MKLITRGRMREFALDYVLLILQRLDAWSQFSGQMWVVGYVAAAKSLARNLLAAWKVQYGMPVLQGSGWLWGKSGCSCGALLGIVKCKNNHARVKGDAGLDCLSVPVFSVRDAWLAGWRLGFASCRACQRKWECETLRQFLWLNSQQIWLFPCRCGNAW